MKTPFCLSNHTLTEVMNEYFEDIFMETLGNCSTNPIYFEGEFKPPLTKRLMVLDKCLYSTDAFPSHMAEGMYKLPIYVHGPVEARFEATIRIERVIH